MEMSALAHVPFISYIQVYLISSLKLMHTLDIDTCLHVLHSYMYIQLL